MLLNNNILSQVDGTQESTLKCVDVMVKRKLHMFVIWYGPFLPAVGLCQPDIIKVVLKGVTFIHNLIG